MRLGFTLPIAAAAALTCAAAPALATAAPRSDRALTIHATPHQIVAGDGVLIAGRLQGRDVGDQLIVLWHRIAPQARYTIIGRTRTDSSGRYEFTRAEGIVLTNRSWFVRGPIDSHSRTIFERVAAEVTLTPSASTGTTRHPLTFSGQITPDHAGARVALQEQVAATDQWRTIAVGRVGAGSAYSIAHAWRIPGAYTVRVSFGGDRRNTPAVSDSTTVVIDQTQIPALTINASPALTTSGTPATISGTVDMAAGAAPDPGVTVSLLARQPGTRPFTLQQTATTGSDGSYSFTVQPTTNELYRVGIPNTPRQSAAAFVGVTDTVTLDASTARSTVGGSVAFTGTVAPAKAGGTVLLQRLDRDGQWQTVETGSVDANSSFRLPWTFGTAGTKQFRARVLGDASNVSGVSPAITVDVAQPPLSTLPTA